MSKLAFTPCTGAVGVKHKNCDDNKFLKIEIDGENFSTTFVLQGISLEMSGNYQFLHTVNDFIYFYSFGDRIGMLTVTGIGFLHTCGETKAGDKLFEIYDYYNKKKATVKEGKALDVVLTTPDGKTISLHGFLTGMKLDFSQSETGPIGYWTLRLEVLPKKAA